MKTLSRLECLACDQGTSIRDRINLIARKGDLRDLANCLALHESLPIPYAKTSRRLLPKMWRALLSNGAMQIFLVENRARPVGSRVVSFNAFMFVADEFCAQARSTLPPYLSVELARRYWSGHLPVLDREQIARANAGDGLNVVMFCEGWTRDGFSPEQFLAILEKQGEALHLALRGYRIKEFLAEPIGLERSQWMLDAGARLRRDYSSYSRGNGLSERSSLGRPLLVGLMREEALAHSGGNIASLFVYTAPRFHFSRSQRVLLQRALMGETCEQLAASLDLSTWTVKKRWHAIYDRVSDVDSQLLPPATACGARAASRGSERRRHLLNYLRQHLEELRPYAARTRLRKHQPEKFSAAG
ncbi:MAG TPA: hypothetical protein VKD89_06960 [Candidatus Udaeobacter sp.]|nr:hypothetical protein [Candidatus Udaeobacter sp.]